MPMGQSTISTGPWLQQQTVCLPGQHVLLYKADEHHRYIYIYVYMYIYIYIYLSTRNHRIQPLFLGITLWYFLTLCC